MPPILSKPAHLCQLLGFRTSCGLRSQGRHFCRGCCPYNCRWGSPAGNKAVTRTTGPHTIKRIGGQVGENTSSPWARPSIGSALGRLRSERCTCAQKASAPNPMEHRAGGHLGYGQSFCSSHSRSIFTGGNAEKASPTGSGCLVSSFRAESQERARQAGTMPGKERGARA